LEVLGKLGKLGTYLERRWDRARKALAGNWVERWDRHSRVPWTGL
jgi:hypothetical protein